MKSKFFISFLFLNLMFGSLLGQEYNDGRNSLNFKHFSTGEGLSHRSVTSILQDSNGYIWFGTMDGLNKYDGNSFTIYRYNSQDSQSLSNNKVVSIFQDSDENLWIGTRNGLNKYNPDEDNFKRYIKSKDKQSLSDNQIRVITQQDDDHLWIGTNNGLEKFNIKEQLFTHFKYLKKDPNSLSGDVIRGLLVTSNNNLWINTPENIVYYNSKTNSFKHYPYPKIKFKESVVNTKSTLFEDSKGNLWLGYENGLAIFNKELQTFVPFKKNSITKDAITSAVRTICEDHFGNLWIGAYNGLYLLNAKNNIISYFSHNENNPKSLSENSIYKIIVDTKGDLWIGTWAGGINYFDRSYDVFEQFSSGGHSTMLNYGVVSAIIEDPDENLWIGTEGGGINFFNKKTGDFTYYKHDKTKSNSLSSNNVKAMLQDHNGNLWIGTHGGGLNFFNPNKYPHKFKTYKHIPGDINSISDNKITMLLEDHQHNIWIGTLGGGINLFDNTTKSIIRLKDKSKTTPGVHHTIIRSFNENILYIGGNNGIKKINIQERKITEIYSTEENENVLSRAQILSLYEDPLQNIWIGTGGRGLYYYNTSTHKIINYGILQGLPNETIYGILPDDNGHIWMSTNNGLSKFNLKTKKIINYDKYDGLQDKGFNYGAYLKNKKGELMFGGTKGVNIFNPNHIIENDFIPPVIISAFQVNNKPFLNITKSVKEIILQYDQNMFSFDFVALSYSQPNKNQYAYKLEGFDPNWNYIGNKRSATYTNLDAGNYTFIVKASNDDGLWNEKGTSIKLIILPAPWKTWWAFLIYGLIFACVALMIIKYTFIRIREKNELKRERLGKEKLEEINQMKLRLFTNISHDFRTPLTLIIGPLERLLKTNKEGSLIHEQLNVMHRNASVLLQLINQLLDFRKNESGKLQLHASKNNMVLFIKNIKLSFEEHASHRNINYKFISPGQKIEVWFDKIKVQKILFNLLSNAFKFTADHGEISIKISIVKNTSELIEDIIESVKIEVEDNGKGISEKNSAFVFDRFYQLEDQQGLHSGTGIGLALTKNLVELHKGTITVKSTENKGTCFTVLLPLGNSHLSPEQLIKGEEGGKELDQFEFDKPLNLQKGSMAKETRIELNKLLPSILLVEDNVEVRTFIKSIFSNKYNIYEAENGEKALSIAKSQSIELIISDIMMPVMDGIELCKNIKTNIKTSHIPVILLTARTSTLYQNSGYKIGADVYITKPFDANILELRVGNLLKTQKYLIEKFKKDLILEPKELTITSADELFLQKAIEVVEQNMSNYEFNTTSFVSEMNMSRSLVYNKLKALTDQSTSEFIRTVKLKKAGQLIKETKMTISEIAFELGFNDLKYFRQSFRKLFNVNPSQYRLKNTTDTSKNKQGNSDKTV